jgi:hypothetical protein
MTVSTKIRRKDWQTVNVILDFKELKVLKASVNGVNSTKDWDTVVSTYYEHYSNIIERLFQENGHAIDIKAAPAKEVSAN